MAAVKSMLKSDVKQEYQKYAKGWWKLVRRIPGRGGTSSSMIPEVRGTRGSLPAGLSQPVDPGGVGGFQKHKSK